MRLRQVSVAASLSVLAAICAVPGLGMSTPERKVIRSEGCVAIGTHSVAYSTIRPWDCFYRATGPSLFVASTTNPFVITVSGNDGKTWSEVVRRPGIGAPTAGFIPSKIGDLVSVSISCWDYPARRPCTSGAVGGRHGTIVAHSEI